MQNLARILEVGAEFPIRRDPDFQNIAHLIELDTAARSLETVRRLRQSFSDRSKRLKPESTAFERAAEQHQRDVEKATVLDAYGIREAWFRVSKEYGYITRIRGRRELPPVRHPQFWLKIKKIVGETEWRRMWASGLIRPETLRQIRAYIVAVDPKLEDSLMSTVDHALFVRRRLDYDEERPQNGKFKGNRRTRNNRQGRGRRPKPD